MAVYTISMLQTVRSRNVNALTILFTFSIEKQNIYIQKIRASLLKNVYRYSVRSRESRTLIFAKELQTRDTIKELYFIVPFLITAIQIIRIYLSLFVTL